MMTTLRTNFNTKRMNKVLCVLWTIIDNKPYFVVFKDREHGEWTFISGGVKTRERFIDAAKRECKEESRELISFDNMHHTYVRGFSEKFTDVNCVHMIYYIRFHTPYTLEHLKSKLKGLFHYRGKIGKFDMENDDVDVVSLEELEALELWPFIRDVFFRKKTLETYVNTLGPLQQVHPNLIKV